MNKDIFLAALDQIVEKEGLITQTEIAHDTGLSQSSISNYLTGKSKPRANSISKIIEVFKSRLNMSNERIREVGEANLNVEGVPPVSTQQDGGNTLVSFHQKIVKGFRFKQKGIDANQALLKIENLDYDVFFREVARLEALSIRLAEEKELRDKEKGAVEPGALGGDTFTGTGDG